jgi:hypothetical protein
MTSGERVFGYTGACGLIQALAVGYFVYDFAKHAHMHNADDQVIYKVSHGQSLNETTSTCISEEFRALSSMLLPCG